MSKDRMDALGVGWHDTTAQRGEACMCCGEGLRKGIRILAERLLPGVPARPHTLHRKCWPRHLAKTEREAAKRRAEKKELDAAPTAA